MSPAVNCVIAAGLSCIAFGFTQLWQHVVPASEGFNLDLAANSALSQQGNQSKRPKLCAAAPIKREKLKTSEAGSEKLRDLGTAVCIVGQSSRLELASKTKNLFEPLAKAGGVGVFFVLEGNSSYFTNPPNSKTGPITMCQIDMGEAEVRNALAPHLRSGLFVKHKEIQADLTGWPFYLMRFYPNNEKKRAMETGGNINQYANIAKCADLIEEDERRQHGRYSMAFRIRDNTAIVKPFTVPAFMQDGLFVKGCRSWGGYNDKVMGTTREYMRDAFTATYELFKAVRKAEEEARQCSSLVDNTEKLLRMAWSWKKLPVRQVAVDKFPFTDARCIMTLDVKPSQTWCLVNEFKDCSPPKPFDAPVNLDSRCEEIIWPR